MSRRISWSLLRKYNYYLFSFKSTVWINQLHSSFLLNSNGAQGLSPAPVENIQFSKLLQPAIPYSVDKILSNVQKDTLSGNESVIHLKALRVQVLFKGADSNSFRNDPKFEDLCYIFKDHCSQMPPHLLISGLRSLLEIGVPSNSVYVTSAEEAVVKNVSNFSVFNLIGCLYYHHKFVETNLQKEVVSVLVTELKKKLCEVTSAGEALMLAHIYYLFDEQHKKTIEQKIIDLAPLFDTLEISKMICTLAETSNRNIVILNVMAFYLKQKTEPPDFKEIVNLCYAFKKLNFFDPKLFTFLMGDLETVIPFITKPAMISGLLTVCGHSRWKNIGILNACALWITKNLDVCRTREFVAYILAVGALNHSSFETKTTLNLMLPHITLENVKSPQVFLDIAWSLSILDYIPKEMLLKVLSEEFHKPLLEESESQATSNIKLKLMNLKGILKLKYPECFVQCNLFLEPFKLQESIVIENSKKHVIQVLSIFVPGNKYMSTNQVSDSGILIDAEFIVDKNMKTLPLQDYGVMSKGISSKPLPKGCSRVALLVMFPKDLTVHSPSLTGANALGTRLLTGEHFTVVHIPYADYSRYKTELQKAKYLVKKIKENITKDSITTS